MAKRPGWPANSVSTVTKVSHAEDSQPNESIDKRARGAPLIVPTIVQRVDPTFNTKFQAGGRGHKFPSPYANNSCRNPNTRPNISLNLSDRPNEGNRDANRESRRFEPPSTTTTSGHGMHYAAQAHAGHPIYPDPERFAKEGRAAPRGPNLAVNSFGQTPRAPHSAQISRTGPFPPAKRRRIDIYPPTRSPLIRGDDGSLPVSTQARISDVPSDGQPLNPDRTDGPSKEKTHSPPDPPLFHNSPPPSIQHVPMSIEPSISTITDSTSTSTRTIKVEDDVVEVPRAMKRPPSPPGSSPAVPIPVKPERRTPSFSPPPQPRTITTGTQRYHPVPLECTKKDPNWSHNRRDWAKRECDVLKRKGLKIVKLFFRWVNGVLPVLASFHSI